MGESNQIPEQLEYVRKFESQLGVPTGFFEALRAEDDWSFVVKLHALVEAAATNLLVEAFDKPELRDQFTRLPLSDSGCGKLSLLKSLNIVSSPYRGFIQTLSELRNLAVHNVEQTSLSLKVMVQESPKDKRKAWAKTLGVGLRGSDAIRLEILQTDPKGLIWISALCLISLLALHKESLKSENNIAKLGQVALELISWEHDKSCKQE